MKIAYIVDCEFSFTSPNSVIKKVLLQTKYWVNQGHDVCVYSLHSGSKINLNNKKTFAISMGYNSGDSALTKLYKIWRASFSIKKDIKKNNFDAIYTRYLLFTFPFLSLFRHHLTVMEINSNDDIEYCKASIFTKYYNQLFKRMMLTSVDSFVCVTNELSSYIKQYSKVNVKVLANGIEYQKQSLFTNVNERPRLSFVASPGNACHGYDIVLKLASSLTEFDFHIVGYDGENKANITFHGYLNKDDLDNVLSHSDIGISALAIQRHGMFEACPLKSREYFSYGLPVIGNYIDTDMDGNDLYCQVSCADLDELSNEVRGFVLHWILQEDRKNVVLKNSFAKLNYETKENQRLVYIETLVNYN